MHQLTTINEQKLDGHWGFDESLTFALSQEQNAFVTDLLSLASWLTDPICRSHEAYWKGHLGESIAWGILSLLTTLPGGILRALAHLLMKSPSVYRLGEGEEKPLDEAFSLLSWNVCCISGGFVLTDAGLEPWHEGRLEKIGAKILEEDADVVCLQEMFDYSASDQLYEILRDKYRYFYFNLGHQVHCPNSALFVASKIKLQTPTFSYFPTEMLDGRTKAGVKGFFSAHLDGRVQLITTHLQHSELPAFPTDGEARARRAEMNLIASRIDTLSQAIITGDLNCDIGEFNQSPWAERFTHHLTVPTWGGDAFSARLSQKPISGPLTLDYTLAQRSHITTHAKEVQFDPHVISPDALSDHKLLLSQINLV